MAAKRFTVDLERVQRTATRFRIPFDLKKAFGRARPPVRVTIHGSFTHRREYVEWVEEAKRPETRARRIEGTLERLRAERAAR